MAQPNEKRNMRTLNDQQGFSAVEAILILVVIAILGFTGWFVWSRQQKLATPKSTSTVQQPPTSDTATITDDSTGWKKYTTKFGGFSLKFPADWKIYSNKTTPYDGGSPDETLEVTTSEYEAAPPAPKGAALSYVLAQHEPKYSASEDYSDFYGCGTQSQCTTTRVHAIDPVDVGGSTGTMYTAQVSQGSPNNAPLAENTIYLYKPQDMKNLPKAGDYNFNDKTYNFSYYNANKDMVVLKINLPSSNMDSSAAIFQSEAAKTGLKILQSVRFR